MQTRLEKELWKFMKCAAYSGGVETLEAYQFRERRKNQRNFYKISGRITNKDVEKLFPKIVAIKNAVNTTGTSL